MSVLVSAQLPASRAGLLNPLTKLAALVILSVPLLVTGDAVMAVGLLAGQVVLLAWSGLPTRTLLRFAWPFLLGLAGVWLANLAASGNLALAVPVTARLAALAVPGVVLVCSTEPVDLADALVAHWHVPARFAYGALAGLRLVPLLGADWTSMRRARRARGLAAGRNPVRAVALGAGLLFALLVSAIRRGTRLAAAMDARGFGAGPRTSARTSTFGRADRLYLAATVAVAVGAAAVAWRAGRP